MVKKIHICPSLVSNPPCSRLAITQNQVGTFDTKNTPLTLPPGFLLFTDQTLGPVSLIYNHCFDWNSALIPAQTFQTGCEIWNWSTWSQACLICPPANASPSTSSLTCPGPGDREVHFLLTYSSEDASDCQWSSQEEYSLNENKTLSLILDVLP